MPPDERLVARQEDAQPEGLARRRGGLRGRAQADASHGIGKLKIKSESNLLNKLSFEAELISNIIRIRA